MLKETSSAEAKGWNNHFGSKDQTIGEGIDQIMKDKHTGMVILPQVEERPVSTYDECMAALEHAVEKRKVSGHALNDRSSRSHFILSLKIST